MFKGQPKGLYALALSNTGERFGYYTMLAIFLLYLRLSLASLPLPPDSSMLSSWLPSISCLLSAASSPTRLAMANV